MSQAAVRSVIYQSLIRPTPVIAGAETINADKWFAALSEPVRVQPRPVGGVTQTHMARGCTFQADLFQEDIFSTCPTIEWHRPLSEPVRLPRITPADLAYGNFVAAVAETINADKWFAALSEPVRPRAGLLAGSQQALALDTYPFVPGPENWRQPLSEPVWTKRLPTADQQVLAFDTYPFVSGPENWAQPLGEPVRTKRLTSAAMPSLSFTQIIPSENVKLDWWAPLSEPVRFRAQLQDCNQQPLEWSDFTPAPPMDSWHKPLSEPVRIRSLLTGSQQTLAFDTYPFVAGPESWTQPLSEPQRYKRLPVADHYPSISFVQVIPAENVKLDWFAALSEPVRLKRLTPADLAYSNFVTAAAETINADKWFTALSEPVRLRGLLPASQQALSFDTYPFVAGPENWRQPLSEPVWTRRLPVADQQVQAWSDFTPPPSMDSWFSALSEPARIRSLFAGSQQALALDTYPFVAGPENWRQPLSEPVWTRRLPTADQQVQAWGDFTPPPPMDSWFSALGEPVRTRAQLKATQLTLAYTALTPIPDATADKWFVGLSEPVRFSSRLLAASQMASESFVQTIPAENVKLDWWAPLSEPVRAPRPLLAGSQQFLAWSNWVQTFFETVTVDKWFMPLVEPVRSKTLPPSDFPTLSFVAVIPSENVKLDWWAPLSEPVRLKPSLLAGSQQFVAALDTYPFVPGPQAWTQPLSEPVRWRRMPTGDQQSIVWDDFTPEPPMDSWFQAFGEPVRTKRLPVAAQPFLATGYYPFVAWDWNRPLSEPVRTSSQLKATQQALSYTALVPIPDSTVDKYFMAFSEPVRLPRAPLATGLTYSNWVQTFFETINADKWFSPLSEPVRSVRITAALQRALAYVKTIDSENVKLDWWHQTSQPVQFRAQLQTALQQYLAFVKGEPFAGTTPTPEVGRTGLPVTDVTALLWNQPVPPKKKAKHELEHVETEEERHREYLRLQAHQQELLVEQKKVERGIQRRQAEIYRAGKRDEADRQQQLAAIEALRERSTVLRNEIAELEFELRERDDEEAIIIAMSLLG